MLRPNLFLKKATDITELDLKKLDVKNLLLDLDDTIVAANHGDITVEFFEWIFRIRKMLTGVVIVSNNSSEERVQYFAEKLNVPYVCRAKKPLHFGINKALRLISADREQSAIAGDQIFTDVLGAKFCRIKSILVEPMSVHRELRISLKRRAELCIKNKLTYGAYD